MGLCSPGVRGDLNPSASDGDRRQGLPTARARSSLRESPLVANLVYKWVSVNQQSTARLNLVLDEAGIENPVRVRPGRGRSAGRSCGS